MTIDKILTAHGINTKFENGNLYALEEWTKEGQYFNKWVNVSNWTITKVKNWLGY